LIVCLARPSCSTSGELGRRPAQVGGDRATAPRRRRERNARRCAAHGREPVAGPAGSGAREGGGQSPLRRGDRADAARTRRRRCGGPDPRHGAGVDCRARRPLAAADEVRRPARCRDRPLFWGSAVATLTGDDGVADALDELVERDFVTREHRSSISGEQAFRFKARPDPRRRLFRLSKDARASLHRRFADWLRERGAEELRRDPGVPPRSGRHAAWRARRSRACRARVRSRGWPRGCGETRG